MTGPYIYDSRGLVYDRDLKPLRPGEQEITDINRLYMETGDHVEHMGRG